MRKPIFLVLFLTVLNISYAAISIDKLSVSDKLDEDLTVNETMLIEAYLDNETEFNLTLPSGASNVMLDGVPFSGTSIQANCTHCSWKLEYTLLGAIEKVPQHLTFTRKLSSLSPVDLVYSVTIPQGYTIQLQENESDPPIVPKPRDVRTDGKNIIVEWTEKSPVLPKIYSIKYYQPVEKTKERFPHLIIWPSLFCLVLGFAAGRFSRRDTRPILPVIPSTLFSPDEKKIIDLLRTDNEKMNQKEIARRLEWSKSKVSAVITNLEYKKVVRREKLGRSFKVELLSDMVDMEDKDQV